MNSGDALGYETEENDPRESSTFENAQIRDGSDPKESITRISYSSKTNRSSSYQNHGSLQESAAVQDPDQGPNVMGVGMTEDSLVGHPHQRKY